MCQNMYRWREPTKFIIPCTKSKLSAWGIHLRGSRSPKKFVKIENVKNSQKKNLPKIELEQQQPVYKGRIAIIIDDFGYRNDYSGNWRSWLQVRNT